MVLYLQIRQQLSSFYPAGGHFIHSLLPYNQPAGESCCLEETGFRGEAPCSRSPAELSSISLARAALRPSLSHCTAVNHQSPHHAPGAMSGSRFSLCHFCAHDLCKICSFLSFSPFQEHLTPWLGSRSRMLCSGTLALICFTKLSLASVLFTFISSLECFSLRL